MGAMQRTFVVAVSGGIDSVALLGLLVSGQLASSQFPAPSSRFIVAHFDHGIRPDSKADREFVQDLAKKYGLQFVFDEGNLGPNASEAEARDARYTFLRRVKDASGAASIVTAHHQDDVLETAILNMLRGTGRKGLSSLKSTDEIYRPLLSTPKSEIKKYAEEQGLAWREDSTNADTKYLRNYIRHRILPIFDADSRQKLLDLIELSKTSNAAIDEMLASQLDAESTESGINRHWFIMLPHEVSREIVAAWLRANGINDFDKKTIERIVIAGKTYAPGKQIDVNGGHIIKVSAKFLALAGRER